VDSEVFSSPLPSGKEFAEYTGELKKLGLSERGESLSEEAPLVLRFLAFADVGSEHGGDDARKALGAAGAEVVGKTLRLWGAATREEFRGRGAYRALVLERCRVGIELGATLALTKANIATSSPTLERAGFRVVARERRHALEVF
jgi:GNAT superfamily N-acetyltransferase